MCPRSHSASRGPTLQASLTHRLPRPDLRARPLPFQSRGPFSGKGRVRAVGARACFPAPRLPLPRVPASKAGALEAAAEGPAGAGCSQRGPWGRGRPQRQAPQEGPRPFLSVPPTAPAAVPAPRGSCNSRKQKPQRRNFPGGPGRLLGPHPASGASRGDGQGLGDGGSRPPLGCPVLPPRWTGDLLAERGHTARSAGVAYKGDPGVLLPPPPGLAAGLGGGVDALGLAEPPPYSPSFWEKIFSKVTSPRSSRYFCMTLRMLEDRAGGGDPESPWLPPGLLALLPWRVAASAPGICSGGHCQWLSCSLPARQPPRQT